MDDITVAFLADEMDADEFVTALLEAQTEALAKSSNENARSYRNKSKKEQWNHHLTNAVADVLHSNLLHVLVQESREFITQLENNAELMNSTYVGEYSDTTYAEALSKMTTAGRGMLKLANEFGGYVQHQTTQTVNFETMKSQLQLRLQQAWKESQTSTSSLSLSCAFFDGDVTHDDRTIVIEKPQVDATSSAPDLFFLKP